ncbi:MAG: pseudouridine synthase [Patescibacteria group bacterium]
MRVNKFLAQATGLSRRAGDKIIIEGRVEIDGKIASPGDSVGIRSIVTVDGKEILAQNKTITIMLNKPIGYVCSRNGQGSKTVYQLLPSDYRHLKPVGRLDKNSSGLLLLTNDGELANQLTHPRYEKAKVYEVTLKTPLQPIHRQIIQEQGIKLDDYVSKFSIARLNEGDDTAWRITLKQGKNRQIRKTFGALGYSVKKLHRTQFGTYSLKNLQLGTFIVL